MHRGIYESACWYIETLVHILQVCANVFGRLGGLECFSLVPHVPRADSEIIHVAAGQQALCERHCAMRLDCTTGQLPHDPLPS